MNSNTKVPKAKFSVAEICECGGDKHIRTRVRTRTFNEVHNRWEYTLEDQGKTVFFEHEITRVIFRRKI